MEASMGAGFYGRSVVGVVDSLTQMFDAGNIVALKQNYTALKAIYPSFMLYTSRATGTDRRTWRTSTLRYAALLLSSGVDLNYRTVPPAYDYPGRDFLKWLKWLTWVQMLGPGDANVTINTVPSTTTPPAKAILDTLALALNDPNPNPVKFLWTEAAAGKITVIVNQTPSTTTPYSITVQSIRSDDIAVPVSDNDEDKQIP
jgi:hypothetical protein